MTDTPRAPDRGGVASCPRHGHTHLHSDKFNSGKNVFPASVLSCRPVLCPRGSVPHHPTGQGLRDASWARAHAVQVWDPGSMLQSQQGFFQMCVVWETHGHCLSGHLRARMDGVRDMESSWPYLSSGSDYATWGSVVALTPHFSILMH